MEIRYYSLDTVPSNLKKKKSINDNKNLIFYLFFFFPTFVHPPPPHPKKNLQETMSSSDSLWFHRFDWWMEVKVIHSSVRFSLPSSIHGRVIDSLDGNESYSILTWEREREREREMRSHWQAPLLVVVWDPMTGSFSCGDLAMIFLILGFCSKWVFSFNF